MDTKENYQDIEKKPLLGLTLEGLRRVVADCGMPQFAAKQIARRLYVNRAKSIDEMTELSKQNRARLAEKGYVVGRQAPLTEMRSTDGTVKYLFPGVGRRDVESVYIPDGDRATLCVSSQAGCKMNCSFCMTGRQGFNGNWSAGQSPAGTGRHRDPDRTLGAGLESEAYNGKFHRQDQGAENAAGHDESSCGDFPPLAVSLGARPVDARRERDALLGGDKSVAQLRFRPSTAPVV